MHKVGGVLIQRGHLTKWQENKAYIILDTDCKKTGSYYTTYELYCIQTQEYSYRTAKTVENEYKNA
jgi:hypothetical protein